MGLSFYAIRSIACPCYGRALLFGAPSGLKLTRVDELIHYYYSFLSDLLRALYSNLRGLTTPRELTLRFC
jgi:hypothetical protein